MSKPDYDVIIVGGGASGMMAAGVAASRGKKVLVLERNAKMGEKLRISGGGRCNILNAEKDEKKLLSNYGSAEQFLYSSFAQFGMKDCYDFFESRGLPLMVQGNNRAFPKSEKAVDVVITLDTYMAEGKVRVKTRTQTDEILCENNTIQGVVAAGKTYTATSYLIATGGLSHPETGSTGDGFRWLTKLGHSVKSPTPTIVPVKVRESWIKRLSGKSLPDVKITFFVAGKKKSAKTGTLLCTHFGLSGPTILNTASDIGDYLQEGPVTATIDLFPDMDLGILDRHLTSIFDENKNKLLRNVFKLLTPPGTTDVILSLIDSIDIDTKVHSILKSERRALAEHLKALPVTIDGLMGFEKAVVADGGVPLEEVDMRTMRSSKISNLYLTGDILNIPRPSGGYSLQLCWTTGFVAGNNV